MFFLHKCWSPSLQFSFISVSALGLMLSLGCGQPQGQAEGEWLKGTDHEQIATIERQFRGFDMAMFEMSYRYQELYWAGKDGNWEYADHQVEHMEVVLRNAMQRRPGRSASAEEFLANGLAQMGAAIAKQDSAGFNTAFYAMTAACNKCHVSEEHSFVHVAPPTLRTSLMRH